MISSKYQNIVFGFVMSLLMSCIMSLAISIINLGFIENIVEIWLKAWGFAFLIAFPTILIVAPIVKIVVGFVIKKE